MQLVTFTVIGCSVFCEASDGIAVMNNVSERKRSCISKVIFRDIPK